MGVKAEFKVQSGRLMQNAVNITLDEARDLVSNRLLWPRVREFLWDFASQVHESWLEPKQLSYRDSPRVKRYILDSLGVEPCFHYFPKDDGSRLMLLDGATLESLAKWLGAIACAESLRCVTSGEIVRELKSTLRGIYPEVFGYTAYFRENDFQRKDAYPPAEGGPQSGCPGRGEARSEDIVAEVVANGYGLLFSAFSKLPVSVVSRAKFKLPKDLRGSASSREIDLPAVFKLLKLKFPEAYKLCC